MVFPPIALSSSQPMIRYFCSIDDTPAGRVSLAYANAFSAMGLSVRIIATRMGALAQQTADGAPWHHHRAAFLAPILGAYVNVVCGDASDWHRLYTVGVKNVLIAGEPPPELEPVRAMRVPVLDKAGHVIEQAKLGDDDLARTVALKYQVIIVPDEEISSHWKALGGNAIVIPMDLGQHALELRSALFS